MNIAASQGRAGLSDWEGVPDDPQFRVFVVFTTVPETQFALRQAANLASRLDARIEVIIPEAVPYPLPLDRPAVSPGFLLDRYRNMARQAGIDAAIHLCFCREPRAALSAALKPGALVVIGVRPRWWLARDARLARWLETLGARVVIASRD